MRFIYVSIFAAIIVICGMASQHAMAQLQYPPVLDAPLSPDAPPGLPVCAPDVPSCINTPPGQRNCGIRSNPDGVACYCNLPGTLPIQVPLQPQEGKPCPRINPITTPYLRHCKKEDGVDCTNSCASRAPTVGDKKNRCQCWGKWDCQPQLKPQPGRPYNPGSIGPDNNFPTETGNPDIDRPIIYPGR